MLEPELLLDAYRRGIFPMAVDKRGTIGWFSPDPRGVIPLDARFHIPHGLRRTLKKRSFAITFDQEFPAVIRECAKRPDGTWISPGIIKAYSALHRLGHAHSVEAWRDRALVGGLYGVHIGGAFSAKACFTGRPTRRRSRWWHWWNGSGNEGLSCSTRNGKRRISGNSGHWRFRALSTCTSSNARLHSPVNSS